MTILNSLPKTLVKHQKKKKKKKSIKKWFTNLLDQNKSIYFQNIISIFKFFNRLSKDTN